VERRDLAPGLWIIRVRPEEPLAFRPGQFATLGVLDGGRMIERPYSIASSPLEDELEFFLERVPGGELTERLHALQPKDAVHLRRAAKGRFAFDAESGHKTHLMVATVTGMAPFVSMVRTLRLEETDRASAHQNRIFLLEGASRSWELGYDAELAEVERATEWLRYVPTISRPWEDSAWKGERGRVHELIPQCLERFHCDPARTTAYLCGHPGMIESGKEILRTSGFPTNAIREERYWVAP